MKDPQNETETQALKAVVEWCQTVAGMPPHALHHSPNERRLLGLLRQFKGEGASIGFLKNLRAKGVSKGHPDLLIYKRPPAAPKKCGVALELKRAPGRGRSRKKPTEEQRKWLDYLKSQGWLAAVAHGQDRAIRLLEKAGYTDVH